MAVLVPSVATNAAHRVVGAAVERAEAEGLTIVACVVDAAGTPVAQLRMTGAPFHSGAIAQDKAYTAASFRAATGALGMKLSATPAVRDGIASRPGVILFGGGIPIVEHGHVIGGVGVSGASEEQDCMLAMAGLAAIQA